MHTNSPEDLIRGGVMFVRDGIIEAVFGAEENVVVPQNAVVIDAEGGFVLPGIYTYLALSSACIYQMNRVYRRPRSLEWFLHMVPCPVLGARDVPCVRSDYVA
jgi:hypothetical protein